MRRIDASGESGLRSARRWLAVATAITLLIGSATALAQATRTKTAGQVCSPSAGCPDSTLEEFGGYTFKGKTTPSEKGQKVRFEYRRANARRWHDFGSYDPIGSGQPDFRSLRGGPTAKTTRTGGWEFQFSAYATGRYTLRATFDAQDGYARSSVTQRVKVAGSE